MSRAFNIQINVGDLDHELICLSDADLASWVRGFQLGLHGKDFPMGGSSSMYCGHAFGFRSYERAKMFMEKSAAGGRVSAARREAKYGTSQPKPEAPSEGSSEGGSALGSEANPEQTINQKPETYNGKQETNNQDTYGPSLPTRNGVGYRLPRSMAGDLGKAYPGVDLDAELTKMSIWLTANPAKGKTAKGMLRFIAGWLGRVRGTPAVPLAEDDGPSEADYLACVEIAKSCEAEQRARTENA